MAGWKLRKDKTQSEEPDAEPNSEAEGAVIAAPPAVEDSTQWETTPDSEQEHTGAVLDLGQPRAQTYSEHAQPTPEPDFEAGSDLHFEDEGATALQSAEPMVAEPAAMPMSKEFSSTLRMNREELATAFVPAPPTGIPSVAPFVLDTPLVAPATPDTPPRLVVRVGRLAGAFDLSNDVTLIGRPDSKLQHYPDVEIDLDDAVSRRHAEVLKRENGFYLRDAGSTNGTLLNGEKLPAQEERLLRHGDRIRVGERTEIVFE